MPTMKVKINGVWEIINTNTSGGSNIELDQTLSIEGMAADSKAVGEAIDNVITQMEDAGSIDIDLNGSNTSEPNYVNADTLGGYPATDYVKHDDVVFGDGDLSVELDNSVEGDINPVNADTLGGINADEYAKLSDLENISAGMTMELLWENASPDSEFAGDGTINLSESCECGVMVSRVQPSSGAHLTSVIFTNVLCRTSYTTGNFDESWYRGFTLNGSSISVGNARRNGNVDDTIIIPYRFYGIKGVS